MRGGRIKVNGGGGEFKFYIFEYWIFNLLIIMERRISWGKYFRFIEQIKTFKGCHINKTKQETK